jgi:hypothetical protein
MPFGIMAIGITTLSFKILSIITISMSGRNCHTQYKHRDVGHNVILRVTFLLLCSESWRRFWFYAVLSNFADFTTVKLLYDIPGFDHARVKNWSERGPKSFWTEFSTLS